MILGVATVHSSSFLYSIVLNLYSRCTTVYPWISLCMDGMELFSGFGYCEQRCCDRFCDQEWICWVIGVRIFKSVKYCQRHFPSTCPSLDFHQQRTRAPGLHSPVWWCGGEFAQDNCIEKEAFLATLIMGPLGLLLKTDVLQLNFRDAQKKYRQGPRGAAPVSLLRNMCSPELKILVKLGGGFSLRLYLHFCDY